MIKEFYKSGDRKERVVKLTSAKDQLEEFEARTDEENKRKQIYDAIKKATDIVMEETSVVKPPIHIPLEEITGSPIEETMKRWLDGINEVHPSLPTEIINEEKEYNHDIVEKVSITDKAYLALYRVAETIYQHLEKHKVIIVQSAHDFGNIDCPFAMCIIKEDDDITGYYIDADWEYFKISKDETKWKPWYPGSEMLIIQTDESGDKVDKAWKAILRETPGEDISALKFFKWTINDDRSTSTFKSDQRNFKYDLYQFLKDRYLYTVIDFLKDNPNFTLDDSLEMNENCSLNFDDPNDEFDCNFYIIYER